MAKRGKRRGARRAGRGNSCCPIIMVKCGRARRSGSLGEATPGFLRTAEQMLSEKKAASKLSSIKSKRIMCTIRVGGVKRRVNAVYVPTVLRKLVRGQIKKRCIPSVNGRLVMGRRAGKVV